MKKLILCFILFTFVKLGYSQLYFTAIQNGSWSSPSTWQSGLAPGTNVNGLRDVNIPVGITVTLDVDVTINTNRKLLVDGALSGPAHTVILSGGNIEGAGFTTLDSLNAGLSSYINIGAGANLICNRIYLSTGSGLTPGTGANIVCNRLTNQGNILNITNGNFAINDELNLIAGWIRLTGNTIMSLADTCWVQMRGGRIRNLTSQDITTNLNVRLSENADSLYNGLSLGADVFGNVEIDFSDPSHEVILADNAIINGSFNLSSGVLNLDGKSISSLGSFTITNGNLKGNILSNLDFSGAGSLSPIVFLNGFETIGNLNFNRPSSLPLGSNLDVAGMLSFNGQELQLGGSSLSLFGDFILNNGTISGGTNASLGLFGDGSFDSLKFTPGSNFFQNLTVNIDTLHQVVLGSDVQIIGTMFTTSGEVVLNGTTLTITGNISKDKGLFVGDASATVVVEGVDTAGTISFKPGAEYLHELFLNKQAALVNGIPSGVLKLGSSLTLDNLFIQDGMLSILYSSSSTKASNSKNVTVNNSTSMNGAVGVASSGPMKSFGSGVNLNLLGDFITTQNALFVSNQNLSIYMSGNGASDTISFATGYDTLATLAYNKAEDLIMGSDLHIWDTLYMETGNINIANSTLSINGTLIIDYAAFIGSPVANMILSGSANIDTLIFLAQTAELNNLTVSVDPGNSVTLGADLTVNGNLYMVSGTLVLSTDTLTISGNIVAENGSLQGNAEAVLIIGGIDSVTSPLTFSSNAGELKSMVVNRANGELVLGSDLTIHSELSLNSGKLYLQNNFLVMDSLSVISTYGVSNYIVADSIGRLVMYVNDTINPITFPVGSSEYFVPVSLVQNSTNSYGQYSVNVNPAVLASGTSGENISNTYPVVGNTWNLATSLDSFSVDILVGWFAEQESSQFNHDSCYLSHFNGVNWDTTASSAAWQDSLSMYFMSRSNVTSFSPFAVFSPGNVCDLTISSVVTPATGATMANGAVDVTVTGGNGSYTYNWSNSATVEDISALLPGSYVLTVVDGNNCTLVDTIIVNYVVSESIISANQVSVYPNPASNALYIENALAASLEFYNILGQMVKRVQVPGANHQVDISEMPQGNYMLKLYLPDEIKIFKLMIK